MHAYFTGFPLFFILQGATSNWMFFFPCTMVTPGAALGMYKFHGFAAAPKKHGKGPSKKSFARFGPWSVLCEASPKKKGLSHQTPNNGILEKKHLFGLILIPTMTKKDTPKQQQNNDLLKKTSKARRNLMTWMIFLSYLTWPNGVR